MLEKRQSFTFVWGFTLGDQVTLQSCTSASVFVDRDPENTSPQGPVAPYTIIAYPDQGTPTVDLLGNGPDNMSWTPRFPPGTTVLLSIVDSLGNSGGVAQTLYTLASGPTSCIQPSSNSDFAVTIQNTPSTVQTCQTIPIYIQGGVKPYTVTIAATNAPTAVNTTMGAANDYFQYINRVASSQTMNVAVSDSTGKYAPTTQFFTTSGSNDTTCGGQTNQQSVYSSSGTSVGDITTATSSNSSSTTGPSSNSGGGKSLTGAIVGTILALLALFGIVAFIFFRRRSSRRRQFDVDGSTLGSGGFGMKDYKRGANLPGNESFLPLADADGVPRTPQSHSTPIPYGAGRPGELGYNVPPSSIFTGTVGGSTVGSTHTGLNQSPLSPYTGTGPPVGVGRPQSKREMMYQEQQRQQQRNTVVQPQDRPESVYPPTAVNPFGDNIYPYSPPDGATPTHSHAPSRSFGSTVAFALGTTTDGGYPASSSPAHTGVGMGSRPTGLQGSPAVSSAMGTGMTSSARAKAAEAAQETRRAYTDDDDDELLPYTQPRLGLGVTNPDRASVATSVNSTASADPYGGTTSHGASGSTGTAVQVYQHEDAGAVIELPPAYREFSATPAPGSAPRR